MRDVCQRLSRIQDTKYTILKRATTDGYDALITEWYRWRDDADWALLVQGTVRPIYRNRDPEYLHIQKGLCTNVSTVSLSLT